MTLQEWRENPSAQKKTWIALGAVGVMLTVLWLPSLNDLKRFFSIRPHAATARKVIVEPPHSSQAPSVPLMPVIPPTEAPALPPIAQLSAPLTGKWAGAAFLPPQHGLCRLTLEVGSNPDGTSSGYSTLGCQPPASDYSGGRVATPLAMQLAKAVNPASAILTGTTDANGVLHFKVMKNIGVAEASHGCNMTSADATPFGAGRMAFEWHEEGCPGGQIVMSHTK